MLNITYTTMNKKPYCKLSMRIIGIQNQDHLMVSSIPTIEDVNASGLGTNPLNYNGGGADTELAW